jgi:hypothetical protein
MFLPKPSERLVGPPAGYRVHTGPIYSWTPSEYLVSRYFARRAGFTNEKECPSPCSAGFLGDRRVSTRAARKRITLGKPVNLALYKL